MSENEGSPNAVFLTLAFACWAIGTSSVRRDELHRQLKFQEAEDAKEAINDELFVMNWMTVFGCLYLICAFGWFSGSAVSAILFSIPLIVLWGIGWHIVASGKLDVLSTEHRVLLIIHQVFGCFAALALVLVGVVTIRVLQAS